MNLNTAYASPDHDVSAFNTDSRDLELPEIEHRVRLTASRVLQWEPQIIFKKIDSTLRGNPGGEIRTALDALGCEVAVITPAFPEMGRQVRNGCLCVEGNATWKSLPVAGTLQDQGLELCRHVNASELREAMARGDRFISVEATCNEDLDAIAAEASQSDLRILWAGSAGLAAALARAFFGSKRVHVSFERRTLPVFFCIGSDHPVTNAQIEKLRNEAETCEISMDGLKRGRYAIFRISREQTGPEIIRELVSNIRGAASAIFLSGGDTASLVCRAIETESIELRGEIITGLPWGFLRGGLLDGLAVATKSGGFGGPEALLKVADFFTCN